jgi:hypothetical protein
LSSIPVNSKNTIFGHGLVNAAVSAVAGFPGGLEVVDIVAVFSKDELLVVDPTQFGIFQTESFAVGLEVAFAFARC